MRTVSPKMEYRKIEKRLELVDQILAKGKELATPIARQTMEEVREAMHL